MDSIISKLILPTSLPIIGPVAAFITTLSTSMGFNETEANMIALALEETMVNVIENGSEDGLSGHFEVWAEQTATGLTIRVRHQGWAQPAPSASTSGNIPAKDYFAMGLGMLLAKKAVDEVIFNNLGPNGKEFICTKYLAAKHIQNYEPTPLPEPELPPASPIQPETLKFQARPFRPEDAMAVARGAYLAYGYNYDDYLYYPERVIELNRQGLLNSIVAETEEGKIIGHITLRRNSADDAVAEAAAAFVLPEYRGLRVLAAMQARQLGMARELGLGAAYSLCPTSHVWAQKMMEHAGGRACGLLIGGVPGVARETGLEYRTLQRETRVLYFLSINPRPPRKVFPPQAVCPVVQKLYRNLTLDVDIVEANLGEMALPPRETEIQSSKIEAENVAYLKMTSYGADAFSAVTQALQVHRRAGAEVIFLYLDLEDPLTAALGEFFIGLGFILAGILPGGLNGHDALILQFLNEVKTDYNRIQLISPVARELLDYVIRHS